MQTAQLDCPQANGTVLSGRRRDPCLNDFIPSALAPRTVHAASAAARTVHTNHTSQDFFSNLSSAQGDHQCFEPDVPSGVVVGPSQAVCGTHVEHKQKQNPLCSRCNKRGSRHHSRGMQGTCKKGIGHPGTAGAVPAASRAIAPSASTCPGSGNLGYSDRKIRSTCTICKQERSSSTSKGASQGTQKSHARSSSENPAQRSAPTLRRASRTSGGQIVDQPKVGRASLVSKGELPCMGSRKRWTHTTSLTKRGQVGTDGISRAAGVDGSGAIARRGHGVLHSIPPIRAILVHTHNAQPVDPCHCSWTWRS
jgi:hypothetical protein